MDAGIADVLAAATQGDSCSMWIELIRRPAYHAVQDAFFKNSNRPDVIFSWKIIAGSMVLATSTIAYSTQANTLECREVNHDTVCDETM
jgi:hypothetical protein